jgi:NTP pyrophosphatase (non-canonical NTP hydrolase)
MELKDLMKKVEAVSLKYSEQYKIKRSNSWFILKLQEEMGELTQSYLMMTGRGRKKDKTKKEIRSEFEKELADVLCHVLLLANSNTVDLEKAVNDKWLKWYKSVIK